jgi:elongation factor Ts
VGEKLEIKRYAMITSGGTVAAYSHAGEQIGSLVAIDLPMQSELAKEIAMQVAASNPKYISSDEIEPAELAREKDIYLEQLRKEGKPEEMLEKIVGGKLNKFFEDICLLNQEFIKDDTKKVSDLLNGAKVEQFVRYAL